MLHEAEHGRQLAHLRFVWVIRSTQLMDALPTVATTDESFLRVTEAGDDVEISSVESMKKPRLRPEVYVTRAKEEDLTGRNNAIQGRPDIRRTIQETLTVAQAKGVGRVAIVTCGPERMVDEVKATCRSMTGLCGQVALDVHDEIFNF